MPWSPCVEECALPVPGEPRVGWVRAWWRLAAATVVLLAVLPVALGYALLGRRVFGGRVSGLGWLCRLMLRAFGVRLVVQGAARFAPPGQGVLVVANHVSWLDILALNAVRPARMVAKHEVRRWPLIGWMATAAGSIYLDRERLSTLPSTVAGIAAALRSGDTVAVFPEGRTWCGRESGAYRGAAFQAAIDAGAAVVPVMLRFLLEARPTSTPAFVGADTLWGVLPRTARLRGLVVEVRVLPPLLPAEHADRRALAGAAQRAVAVSPRSARALRVPRVRRARQGLAATAAGPASG
jgi:1-acyl-sn-glycerol-3-phosphate acyltransferase